MHQAAKFVIRSLTLASAITGSSTCGFAEDTNSGKLDYGAACHTRPIDPSQNERNGAI
jgi:hypothetical protein